jgi:hypothetical protein
MNEATLLKALLGLTPHKAGEVTSNDYERKSNCLSCGQDITSYWQDDEDRLSGWTAWSSTADKKNCKEGKK